MLNKRMFGEKERIKSKTVRKFPFVDPAAIDGVVVLSLATLDVHKRCKFH